MKAKPLRARKQSRIEHTSKPRGVFSVRFSEHELTTLRKAAAISGDSLAGWVRQTVVAAVTLPQANVFILGSQSDATTRAQVFSEDDRKDVWLNS
jgi:uncharacterized protein (DUF1778 family)